MTKPQMVAAFAAVTFIAVLSGSGGDLAAGALPLATWLAALVWAQVKWPLTGLVTGICSVVAMRVAELTTGGWLWPVTLLYVSVVIGPRPRLRLVVGIAAVHAVWAFTLEWAVLQHSASRALAGVGPDVLWLIAALAVTIAIGNWRRWMHTAIQQQHAEFQQQHAEIEQQRAEERLRVAREVHDTVAHTLAVVGVHLNVAADALDTAPDEARAALRVAQDVRRKAMGDLSSLVGVLRDDRRPTAEPLDLEALVSQVRAAGLDAHLHVEGAGAALPVRTAVGLIVREALTNTVRHAAARTVTVTVHYGPTTEVTVADDGQGSTAPEGHGLTGMRERVEALGGSLTTDGAGGFAVHATIPS
ncbi:sensor histidine kinase [Dactylosporangium siamense]|uniref:sensor histidine kinase n=1 Tax=Dactylosporangium siamense TaxID=685454 RepID=UPI0019443087